MTRWLGKIHSKEHCSGALPASGMSDASAAVSRALAAVACCATLQISLAAQPASADDGVVVLAQGQTVWVIDPDGRHAAALELEMQSKDPQLLAAYRAAALCSEVGEQPPSIRVYKLAASFPRGDRYVVLTVEAGELHECADMLPAARLVRFHKSFKAVDGAQLPGGSSRAAVVAPSAKKAAIGRGPCPEGMALIPGNNAMGPLGYASYCIDVTEVTAGAYSACVQRGECLPAHRRVDWPGISEAEREKYSSYCNAARDDRQDHPANCVTWAQAVTYCESMDKRLPSEVEWQAAATSAMSGPLYPWGRSPPANQLCWNGEGNDAGKGARMGTCPVGRFPTGNNKQGVADLAGNVWEWTSTVATCNGVDCRIVRGGGWFDTDPARVSATLRNGAIPRAIQTDYGFRCAKNAQ